MLSVVLCPLPKAPLTLSPHAIDRVVTAQRKAELEPGARQLGDAGQRR